ncbi:MAG: Phytochrome-like protein cph2 [Firmicutes bacterium]|nr:Phytochrome-like protein cph2 [candidate division NPL-UPA2 bacterium]
MDFELWHMYGINNLADVPGLLAPASAQATQPAPLTLEQELFDVLRSERVGIVYQPIISLASAELLGYEALARGPDDSRLSTPASLFTQAEESGALFALERICRAKAVSHLGDLPAHQKLFINVHTRTVCDKGFVSGDTLTMLSRTGLDPSQIVFELTERHYVENYRAFQATLKHYRDQGYRIAIDDVGAGHSGLLTLVELKPDYIKVDMSLVRNVTRDFARQSVIKALCTVARSINAKVVAEGIESEAELAILIGLGVDYGQGYYIARPQNPKPFASREAIFALNRNQYGHLLGSRFTTLGDLTVSGITADETVPVTIAKEMLAETEDPLASLTILRHGVPVGLVMRHYLDRILSGKFGVPLFSRHPVCEIMDRAPLLLDSNTTLDQALEAALTRPAEKLYDDLIALNKDKSYAGVVPMQRLLNGMARLQISLAKGANPLTGLPGNVVIEEEIHRRMRLGQACSVIYADLDDFKAYNDSYGFDKGDKMIVLIARLLLSATRRYGAVGDFIGHIGGDDFVIVTAETKADQLANRIAALFARVVRRCFTPVDWERGAFWGRTREGLEDFLPLTTVSMAIVDCHAQQDYLQLGKTAAQLKKRAKSEPGSVIVRDRRATCE